jgi:hypothetical protein
VQGRSLPAASRGYFSSDADLPMQNPVSLIDSPHLKFLPIDLSDIDKMPSRASIPEAGSFIPIEDSFPPNYIDFLNSAGRGRTTLEIGKTFCVDFFIPLDTMLIIHIFFNAYLSQPSG